MDVGQYVSELLNELNEVSLPGIGTFFKKKTSAYYDDRQGIFFPPSQEYTFTNGNISASPELIKHICSVRNISEPSARYFTEKYSDTIKQSLQIKGYAVIGSLGKLRTAATGYGFEPAVIEDNSSAYGLIPVMELHKNLKDAPPDFSAIKFKAPPEVEKPYVPEGRKNKTGILILVLLLMVAAFVVGSYLYFPQVFNLIKRTDTTFKVQAKPPIAPVPKQKTLQDSMATADSIYADLQKQEGVTVEEARDTIEIKTKAVPVTKDSVKLAITTKYEIICAAFHRKSESEEFIKTLRKKGIDAHIVNDVKKPKFKVSLGSFTDEESAQKEKRRIHETIAKDAWILKIKNN